MISDDVFADVYKDLGRLEGKRDYAVVKLKTLLAIEDDSLSPYAKTLLRLTIKELNDYDENQNE